MSGRPAIGRVARLWRYYQAGVVNTLFGYGMYALFVKLGLDMYVAQIAAHVLGVVFNYFTYSRHAFRDFKAAKLPFFLSYGVNYILSLASLAAAAEIFSSPYVAGLVATLFVSLLNYFVLKHFVFTKPSAG